MIHTNNHNLHLHQNKSTNVDVLIHSGIRHFIIAYTFGGVWFDSSTRLLMSILYDIGWSHTVVYSTSPIMLSITEYIYALSVWLLVTPMLTMVSEHIYISSKLVQSGHTTNPDLITKRMVLNILLSYTWIE